MDSLTFRSVAGSEVFDAVAWQVALQIFFGQQSLMVVINNFAETKSCHVLMFEIHLRLFFGKCLSNLSTFVLPGGEGAQLLQLKPSNLFGLYIAMAGANMWGAEAALCVSSGMGVWANHFEWS